MATTPNPGFAEFVRQACHLSAAVRVRDDATSAGKAKVAALQDSLEALEGHLQAAVACSPGAAGWAQALAAARQALATVAAWNRASTAEVGATEGVPELRERLVALVADGGAAIAQVQTAAHAPTSPSGERSARVDHVYSEDEQLVRVCRTVQEKIEALVPRAGPSAEFLAVLNASLRPGETCARAPRARCDLVAALLTAPGGRSHVRYPPRARGVGEGQQG